MQFNPDKLINDASHYGREYMRPLIDVNAFRIQNPDDILQLDNNKKIDRNLTFVYFIRYLASFPDMPPYAVSKELFNQIIKNMDAGYQTQDRTKIMLPVLTRLIAGRKGAQASDAEIATLVEALSDGSEAFHKLVAHLIEVAIIADVDLSITQIIAIIQQVKAQEWDRKHSDKVDNESKETQEARIKKSKERKFAYPQPGSAVFQWFLKNISQEDNPKVAKQALKLLVNAACNQQGYPLACIAGGSFRDMGMLISYGSDLLLYNPWLRTTLMLVFSCLCDEDPAKLQKASDKYHNRHKPNIQGSGATGDMLGAFRAMVEEISDQIKAIYDSNNELKKALVDAVLAGVSKIDIACSKPLPTFNDLNQLIKAVNQFNKPLTMGEIPLIAQKLLAEKLPQTVVFEAQMSSALTLNPRYVYAKLEEAKVAYIKKMQEEGNSEQANKPVILEKTFGQNYQTLQAPGGHYLFIGNATTLGEQISLKLQEATKSESQAFMQATYKTSLVEHIKKSSGLSQEILELLFATLKFPLSGQDQKQNLYVEFTVAMRGTSELFATLNTILEGQATGQLETILSILASKKEALSRLEPQEFKQILQLALQANQQFSHANKNDFPLSLFEAMLEIKGDFETHYKLLTEILKHYKAKNLSAEQQAQIIKIILGTGVEENSLSDFFAELDTLQKTVYFQAALTVLAADSKNAMAILEKIEKLAGRLKNAKLMQEVLALYQNDEKNLQVSFDAFASVVLSNTDIDAKLIEAMVLAASQSKQSTEIHAEIMQFVKSDKLKNESDRKNITSLYYAGPYPNLKELDTALTNNKLKALENLYGQDPYGYRAKDPKLLKAQFASTDFSRLIDELLNLGPNHKREIFPHYQRQELFNWLLYINAIGSSQAILVCPWNNDNKQRKTIREMTKKEMRELLDHYKDRLNGKEVSADEKLGLMLECIAILRELMYRTTTTQEKPGIFPYATQLLPLLIALQKGMETSSKVLLDENAFQAVLDSNLFYEIDTGEGKSCTSALFAGLKFLLNKRTCIASSDSELAKAGLKKHRQFFQGMGATTAQITASSTSADAKANIVYSTLSEFSLYRISRALNGETIEFDTLIADEGDFLMQDENTAYRYAISDDSEGSGENPYVWIYAKLIDLIDNYTQKDKQMSDKEHLERAKEFLKQQAIGKQKEILEQLEKSPDIYNKRLQVWMLAVIQSKPLLDKEEQKYRVLTLNKKVKGVQTTCSAACILDVNGRPSLGTGNISPPQFADVVHQCLEVRLQQRYYTQINNGEMPAFHPDPESTNVRTLDSRLVLSSFRNLICLSGTAGNCYEMREMQGKYGTYFVKIPRRLKLALTALPTLLTSAKNINNPEAEQKEHIQLIVSQIIEYLEQTPKGKKASCMLIDCKNKMEGEAINSLLNEKLSKKPELKAKLNGKEVQRYYGSDKPTSEERTQKEEEVLKAAGKNGQITISSVLGRGSDIEPENHEQGLFLIVTYVDSFITSVLRKLKQIVGRTARNGGKGTKMALLKRSEFKLVLKPAELAALNSENVGAAIGKLSKLRNEASYLDRNQREAWNSLENLLYEAFSSYIEILHTEKAHKLMLAQARSELQNELLLLWQAFIAEVYAEYSEKVKQKTAKPIEVALDFAIQKWQEFESIAQGKTKAFQNVPSYPKEKTLAKEIILEKLNAQKPLQEEHYLKIDEKRSRIKAISENAVYARYNSKSTEEDRKKAANSEITAIKQTLQCGKMTNDQQFIKTLLTLRYQAYVQDNADECVVYTEALQAIEEWIYFGNDRGMLDKFQKAHAEHYSNINKRTVLLSAIDRQEYKTASYLNAFDLKRFDQEVQNRNPEDIKAVLIKQLQAYLNHWPWVAFISSDRKVVASELLQKLQKMENTTGKSLIDAIQTARKELLDADKKKKRTLAAGLNGRLNSILEQTENSICAFSKQNTFDKNMQGKFVNITKILEILKDKIQDNNLKSTIEGSVRILASNEKTPVFKYQAFLIALHQIQLFMSQQRQAQTELNTLYRYLQQKDRELAVCFSNNQQAEDANKTALGQAVLYAAQSVLEQFKPSDDAGAEAINLEAQLIAYHNYTVSFENGMVNLPDWLKNAKLWQSFLEFVEGNIVESSQAAITLVRFTKVSLAKKDNKEDQFNLKVEMLVNNVKADVSLMIDAKEFKIVLDDNSKVDVQLTDQIKKEEKQEEEKSVESLTQYQGTFFGNNKACAQSLKLNVLPEKVILSNKRRSLPVM